ncbi:hypothetical protein DPSP01_014516 [Paraphaeosphaeria sporulosa]
MYRANGKRSADSGYVRGSNKRLEDLLDSNDKRQSRKEYVGEVMYDIRSTEAEHQHKREAEAINRGANSRRDPYVRGQHKREAEPVNKGANSRRDPYVRGQHKREAEPVNKGANSRRDADTTIERTPSGEPINGRDAEPEPINRINGRDAEPEPINRINGRDAVPEPINRINGRDAEPEPYVRGQHKRGEREDFPAQRHTPTEFNPLANDKHDSGYPIYRPAFANDKRSYHRDQTRRDGHSLGIGSFKHDKRQHSQTFTVSNDEGSNQRRSAEPVFCPCRDWIVPNNINSRRSAEPAVRGSNKQRSPEPALCICRDYVPNMNYRPRSEEGVVARNVRHKNARDAHVYDHDMQSSVEGKDTHIYDHDMNIARSVRGKDTRSIWTNAVIGVM